jgi:hypothetical protein
MGEQDVSQVLDEQQQRAFMKALLDDLRALELMLEGGLIESGVRRIGSEQEMFLVDSNLGAAPVAEEVLARVNDERFVAEIARFNLEANLTPRMLGGRCLRLMEEELSEVLRLARDGARACGSDVLLGGILPTLALSDLRMLADGPLGGGGELIAVRLIMNPDPVSVAPKTPVAEAVELMRRRRIGSLPVVEDGRLVGIVTVYDFLESAARLSAEKPDADGPHAP